MRQSIGNILQEELKKEGKPSLQDFASMIGISYRTLFNVFKGESELSFSQIVKSSEILDIDLISKILYAEKKEHILETDAVDKQKSRTTKTMSISFNVSGSVEHLTSNFPEFIEGLRVMAEKCGLRVE